MKNQETVLMDTKSMKKARNSRLVLGGLNLAIGLFNLYVGSKSDNKGQTIIGGINTGVGIAFIADGCDRSIDLFNC
jgi:uncharacterized membrane protein HdeD (DUF308 family)